MKYYCDGPGRHLVCIPYTVENLHLMAQDLDIKRCWFHNSKDHLHYDSPKRRIEEITAKCTLVTGRQIVEIIKTGQLTQINGGG